MRVLPAGLRGRSAVGFAALAFVLSLLLSLATYQLARYYLLDQRQSLAIKQAVLHAQVLGGELSGLANATDEEVLALLAQTRSRVVLQVGETWYAPVVGLDQSGLSPDLVDDTRAGTASLQRVFINQVPYFVVGIPITGAAAVYFEFVPAEEYQGTLQTLAYVLAGVASVTTALGALSGWVLSKRVLKPLETIAVSAHAMSEGDLDHRLKVGDDPDLRPVVDSFNSMAASLQNRIAREQRFTADVSHELRTPLTAMSSAVALAKRSGDAGADVVCGRCAGGTGRSSTSAHAGVIGTRSHRLETGPSRPRIRRRLVVGCAPCGRGRCQAGSEGQRQPGHA